MVLWGCFGGEGGGGVDGGRAGSLLRLGLGDESSALRVLSRGSKLVWFDGFYQVPTDVRDLVSPSPFSEHSSPFRRRGSRSWRGLALRFESCLNFCRRLFSDWRVRVGRFGWGVAGWLGWGDGGRWIGLGEGVLDLGLVRLL